MKAFFHYMQLAEMRSCISRSSVSSPAVAWTVWFTPGTACTGISVTIITGQAVYCYFVTCPKKDGCLYG